MQLTGGKGFGTLRLKNRGVCCVCTWRSPCGPLRTGPSRASKCSIVQIWVIVDVMHLCRCYIPHLSVLGLLGGVETAVRHISSYLVISRHILMSQPNRHTKADLKCHSFAIRLVQVYYTGDKRFGTLRLENGGVSCFWICCSPCHPLRTGRNRAGKCNIMQIWVIVDAMHSCRCNIHHLRVLGLLCCVETVGWVVPIEIHRNPSKLDQETAEPCFSTNLMLLGLCRCNWLVGKGLARWD